MTLKEASLLKSQEMKAMNAEEMRRALVKDAEDRIAGFLVAFHELEVQFGVTVKPQVFLTPDGRIDAQVVPVTIGG